MRCRAFCTCLGHRAGGHCGPGPGLRHRRGPAGAREALRQGQSALTPNRFTREPLPCHVGRIQEIEATKLPGALSGWDCRATRAAWLGLQADSFMQAAQAARQRHGAARVGLVLGTSASTIGASEEAYRNLDPDGGFPRPPFATKR